ncbi:MAG: ABC transporter ATP-binding protein [Anaerolineales bacterium]|nr:ABC transporter ATP-binding protein [Anaerolineales bacterium]
MTKTNPAPILVVKDLTTVFPDADGGLHALDRVSFTVRSQEFVCVLGPSGSGKSTLLRVLAGLINPTSGELKFQVDSSNQPKIGIVFQHANLMPWRRALENVSLPLELQGMHKKQAREKAIELFQQVGLQGFEDSWPRELSGGMAQRVGIARALAHDPEILLLDEPFGLLDALTREHMWTELLNIWGARQKTILMVTHSISEALFLADRVLVLTQRPGSIKLDLPVILPRPRQDEMRYTPAFGKLARQLKEAIGEH